MTFARKVAALAVAMVGLSTVFIGVGAASAATVEDCKTVNAGLANHPDSGLHGTWATDTIARTVKVCQLDTAQWTDAQVSEVNALQEKYTAAPFSVYSVDVSDTGTFVTKGGAHLSPQDGDALTAGIHGTLEGYYKTFVVALKNWQSWNGPAVEGQTYNPGDSTGEWLKMLFGEHAKWSDPYAWQWVYTTCNQVWKNGAGGNTGDITGEVPCPSPSPSASPSPAQQSASPSPSNTTGAPAAPAPQGDDGGDLPVTGSALYGTIGTGAVLVVAGIVALVVMARRRRVN
jgi:hypothetical protein